MTYLSIQIDYLLWLQHLRDISGGVFDSTFLFITDFGQTLIPILICAITYWCINKKVGAFAMLTCAFSLMFNQLIKNIACIYRPWILDSRVTPVHEALKTSSGYSFPSGHTTISTSIWGAFAIYYKKNKLLLTNLILIILLVAFSRNYLGVHTPQDVIVALICAVIVLIFAFKAFNWCDKGKNRDIFISIFSILFGLSVLIFVYFKNYPMDYLNGKLLVNPYYCKLEAFPKCGFLVGVFSGWVLERHFVNFDEISASLKVKITRGIIGLIPLSLLSTITYKYCKILFGSHLGYFLNYFAVGIFITLIYPYFIKKFKI